MENELKLPFPLDLLNRFALKKGGFILSGSTTLASGAATVSDRRIQPSSISLVSHKTHSSPGILRSVCTQGQLTITSASGSDASELYYLVIL